MTHRIIGIAKTRIQIPKKSVLLPKKGKEHSFKKSLIASAKGTNSPKNPGLLGPFRRWI
jgi:hypothetical protein